MHLLLPCPLQNSLYEEDGEVKAALEHLESSESQIVDKLHYHEKRAQLLAADGRFGEAELIYRGTLLKRNPEHYGYHAGLQAAVLQRQERVERWVGTELPEGAEPKLRALYTDLQAQFPRSTICRRIPLDVARSAEYFREAAVTYILPLLRKGVPALFADVKPLYVDSTKAKVLGELFESWLAGLLADGCLPGESERELPSTIMWVRVLLAQHLDKTGKTEAALEMMEAAIEHTPTLLDLYMHKVALACS